MIEQWYLVKQANAEWPEYKIEAVLTRAADNGWKLVSASGTGSCTLTFVFEREASHDR